MQGHRKSSVNMSHGMTPQVVCTTESSFQGLHDHCAGVLTDSEHLTVSSEGQLVARLTLEQLPMLSCLDMPARGLSKAACFRL